MIHESNKLSIYKAVVIIDKQPALNRHGDNFITHLNCLQEEILIIRLVAVHTRSDTGFEGYINANAAPSRYLLRSRPWKFIAYS